MQLYGCPWCGPRPDAEFRYGGDAGKRRPERGASDAEWADYLYFRHNTKGRARELWFHHAGCRRWVELDRDTATHTVHGVEPMTR